MTDMDKKAPIETPAAQPTAAKTDPAPANAPADDKKPVSAPSTT